MSNTEIVATEFDPNGDLTTIPPRVRQSVWSGEMMLLSKYEELVEAVMARALPHNVTSMCPHCCKDISRYSPGDARAQEVALKLVSERVQAAQVRDSDHGRTPLGSLREIAEKASERELQEFILLARDRLKRDQDPGGHPA